MPTYSYECRKGHEYDEFLPMSDYRKETFCPKCKQPGQKVIKLRASSPSFSDNLYPYYDPNLGCRVDSATERQRIMNQMGFITKEGGRRTTAKQEKYLLKHRI